ncbi:MAG: SpoIID/LytB domain-containing protein, partial [Candidatus Bipolaricaulia bacterium]
LEEYLYGVLRNEMSVDWPMEALKSQAVAARTYAVYKAMQNQNRPYDLVDHEVDQVYNGFDTEHDRIRQAVDATRGEILIYQGEPVEAFYSSQSGDYTANSENIWGNYVPYLRSVSSPFEADAPYYRWEISLTYEELAAHLNRDWRLKIGLIYDLEIRRSPQSRRVTHVWIHHSNGRETVLTGVEFKNLARLPSTLFTVTRNEYGVTFAGSGRGHGLGLSQWGARGYALNGYNYRAILQHYYPGVEIVKLRETEILARR